MKSHDEFFDVYFDVSVSLFSRLHEKMDRHYNAKPRTPDDLVALKTIRDKIIQIVAEAESVDPKSIYGEIEDVRNAS